MRHITTRQTKRAGRGKPLETLEPLAGLILCAILTPPLWANDDGALTDVMLGHLNKLIVVFDTIQDPEQQRREVGTVVDFGAITRGVIGKHRQSMSPIQQNRFQAEFEKSITHLLATALQDGEEYVVTIERIRRSTKNPDRAQVLGVMTTPGQDRFELLTTTARSGDTWLVRNLTVNGVNLGITYRTQFNELVTRHAGDFDTAIAAWAASLADKNSS